MILSPNAYLGSSTKRLVIKEGALTPKMKPRLQLTLGSGGTPRQEEKKEENCPHFQPQHGDNGNTNSNNNSNNNSNSHSLN